MTYRARTLTLLAAAGAVLWSASAQASSDLTGLWYDHDGRGAVEIAPCSSGNGICGHIVHIKDPSNTKHCGTQILGNVTSDGGGWIYSPSRGRKFPVAVSALANDKLRVVGNAGSFISKTFTWKRAPDDVARCGETTAAAPPPAKKQAEPEADIAHETEAAPRRKTKTDTEQRAARTIERPLLTGASSATVALLAAPRLRMLDVAPETAPAVTEDSVSAEQPAPERTAAAEDRHIEAPVEEREAAPAPIEEETAKPERMCKYKIPYVGRVISVPCRN